MSYRTPSDRRREWQCWLDRNLETLLQIGLPISHFQEKQHWWYFLEHGYTNEFTIDWLTTSQQLKLLSFLSQSELRRTDLANWLRHNAGDLSRKTDDPI